MGIEQDLAELERLRESGLLSAREYRRARDRVIRGSRPARATRSDTRIVVAAALVTVGVIALVGGALVYVNDRADQREAARAEQSASAVRVAESQAAQAAADQAADEQAQAAAAQAQAAQEAAADCKRVVGPFVDSLNRMRVEVYHRVYYAEYEELLTDAQFAHDRIVLGDVDSKCTVDVVGPAEKALRRYQQVSNIWSSCSACVSQDPAQRYWNEAWSAAVAAKQALAAL